MCGLVPVSLHILGITGAFNGQGPRGTFWKLFLACLPMVLAVAVAVSRTYVTSRIHMSTQTLALCALPRASNHVPRELPRACHSPREHYVSILTIEKASQTSVPQLPGCLICLAIFVLPT